MKFRAQATGITTLSNGAVLGVWFPTPKLIEEGTVTSTITGTIGAGTLSEGLTCLVDLAVVDADHGTTRRLVAATTASFGDAPVNTINTYLRLHLSSHRLATPNGINLDSTFDKPNNVVWTNFDLCAVESFEIA